MIYIINCELTLILSYKTIQQDWIHKYLQVRLRYLLPDWITRIEYTFPSDEWEKKYSTETADIVL